MDMPLCTSCFIASDVSNLKEWHQQMYGRSGGRYDGKFGLWSMREWERADVVYCLENCASEHVWSEIVADDLDRRQTHMRESMGEIMSRVVVFGTYFDVGTSCMSWSMAARCLP